MRCIFRLGGKRFRYSAFKTIGRRSIGDWPCGPVPIFKSQAKSKWGQAPTAPDPLMQHLVIDGHEIVALAILAQVAHTWKRQVGAADQVAGAGRCVERLPA